MDELPGISIIIPVRNEEENIPALYEEIMKVLSRQGTPYEILFIDDGSTDGTVNALRSLEKADDNVEAIVFRKNYGKAAALSCGFSRARGAIIISMDGDLQDDPAEIPRFVEALKQYDMVSGWKQKRHDSLTKIAASRFFNLLTRWLTGVLIHDFNCGFKGYRRELVKNIDLYGELHRYIPAIASQMGYRVGEIPVKHRRRMHGRSKYGPGRLFRGFFDLLTVKFLMSYSQKPLHFFGGLGLVFCGLGSLIWLYLLYQWLNHIKIGDRPLLTMGFLLLVIGMQFVAIGLIGELITNKTAHKSWIIKKEED